MKLAAQSICLTHIKNMVASFSHNKQQNNLMKLMLLHFYCAYASASLAFYRGNPYCGTLLSKAHQIFLTNLLQRKFQKLFTICLFFDTMFLRISKDKRRLHSHDGRSQRDWKTPDGFA
ncbi:MAG: hypothetical protein HFI90_07730 [Clostridia bacterium]|nr:hypothetical protein [Clostridia bacterium]